MDLKIPPPLLALMSAVTMWAIAESSAAAWIVLNMPDSLSLLVLAAGLGVEISAVALFRRASTTVNPMKPGNTVQLVDVGVYKFSRNPMYLGVLLILSAWALWLENILNLAVLLFFIWYITRFQIIPEERVLRKLFPGQFDAYRSRVRRWI